jgi:hypothetical protein
VLPTIHARVEDRVYLHGSTGTPPVRLAAGSGVAVCLTVTLVDGVGTMNGKRDTVLAVLGSGGAP